MSEGQPKRPSEEKETGKDAEQVPRVEEAAAATPEAPAEGPAPAAEAVPEAPVLNDEAPPPEGPAPGGAEGGGRPPRESAAERNVVASLSQENQGFFNKMSEGAKEVMRDAATAVTPDARRIVGKMGIAYNQFWLDRHAKKAAGMKREMDLLDMQTSALDTSKNQIASMVGRLSGRGMPGTESIALKLNDIDRQKAALLNKKDRIQSKFESRDNKVKLYANERDRIADKLIERYNAKLAPIEQKLEHLETRGNDMDLSIAVTEAKQRNELAELTRTEKEVEEIAENLRKAGTSESEIRKLMGPLTAEVAKGREAVRVEKERMAKEKGKIEKSIAKTDARANPYRDKREEFVRVKEGRPLKMEVPTRTRGTGDTGTEEVRGRAREAAPEREAEAEAGVRGNEGAAAANLETAEEGEANPTLSDWVSGWEKYLEKQPNKKEAPPFDRKNFLAEMSKRNVSENFNLDPRDFKKILETYYKMKKLPKGVFATAYANFIKTL